MTVGRADVYGSPMGSRLDSIRLLGVGAGAPTVSEGNGFTVTRQAAGVYRLTWSENPGKFVALTWGLGASTPANVKGHTITHGDFNATSFYLEVSLFDSSFAADDLQTAEKMSLRIGFKELS